MHFISKSKKQNNMIHAIQEINESKQIQNNESAVQDSSFGKVNIEDSPFGKQNTNNNKIQYMNDYENNQNEEQYNFDTQIKQRSTVNSTTNDFYKKKLQNGNKEIQNSNHSSKIKYNSYQEEVPYKKFQEAADNYTQAQTEIKTNKSKSNNYNNFKDQFFSTNISQDSPHFNHILNNSKSKYENTSDVKKKLFETRQSKNNELLTLYKANLNSYEKQFNQNVGVSFSKTKFSQGKLNFERLCFNNDTSQNTNQNNPHIMNRDLGSVRKKLAFEESSSIMQEINKQALLLKGKLNTSQKRKNPQKQMMKALIAQNKQSIRDLYLLDSKNVQYEYRKSKFMNIFLGKQESESLKKYQ